MFFDPNEWENSPRTKAFIKETEKKYNVDITISQEPYINIASMKFLIIDWDTGKSLVRFVPFDELMLIPGLTQLLYSFIKEYVKELKNERY